MFRHTKIVCTIGPASNSRATLSSLIDAGMNVVRLNMSHGTHEAHAEVIRRVRELSAEKGATVAILLDLCGPKIRLGKLAATIELHEGDIVTLTDEKIVGEGMILPVEYPDLATEFSVGDHLSLADGLIDLEVTAVNGHRIDARVLSPGKVTSHKGVHLPNGGNHLPTMTDRDIEDLRFGLRQDVDWVALSFVREGRDAQVPRKIMVEEGIERPLIAKIERRQAVNNIDAIIESFDGLMVARGDLGVEMPIQEIPGIQKRLIRLANQKAKPVITATQMLLSMVSAPQPTRAEVTDVANAILDGTDAVMLSEETAMGNDPLLTVITMDKIARQAEKMIDYNRPLERHDPPVPVEESISRAVRKVAQMTGAKLVISPTSGGGTPRIVASNRPEMPILALSANADVVNALALSNGVVPRRIETFHNTEELFSRCREQALASGHAERGDLVVVSAGYPLERRGTTNMLQVMTL